MVIERPDSSAIHDLPLLVDDVNPLRPRRIGVIGDVVHIVYREGHREMESLDEIVGDSHALLGGMRLRVAHALIHIRFHLPLIQRVRFTNVNREKIRAILVIVVEIDEVAYLAPKRRSGIAAEYQHQRALADAIAQMKSGLPIQRQQAHIRRGVADF